jgi:hypothetical protein
MHTTIVLKHRIEPAIEPASTQHRVQLCTNARIQSFRLQGQQTPASSNPHSVPRLPQQTIRKVLIVLQACDVNCVARGSAEHIRKHQCFERSLFAIEFPNNVGANGCSASPKPCCDGLAWHVLCVSLLVSRPRLLSLCQY